MKLTRILFILLATGLFTVTASAQTTVTFKLDLKQALKDSLLIPPYDKVIVKGNIRPLSLNTPIYLKDEFPKDSVFTAEVEFNRFYNGKQLRFNYFLETRNKTYEEPRPRMIRLTGTDIELPPIQFGATVW